MKRIVFLIIASLLVLALVLPGCGEPAPPVEKVTYTFEDGEIVIGIVGDSGHPTGDFNYYGALIAQGEINGAGGVVIDGLAHNITLQIVDTDEGTDETGSTGATALLAAIDVLDFCMGGYRSEAVVNYREVAMDEEKIFIDCGAATEALTYSVADDYDTYKYWLKGTPYNEYFLAGSVLRVIDAVARQLRDDLGLAVDAELRACIIAEDLMWSADELVPKLEAGLPAINVGLNQTYLVSSLDSAATIGAVGDAVTYNPHIIIPVYSGAMGVYYAGTLASYIGLNLTAPMSVGISVYEQLKAPWVADLGSAPPGGPTCGYHVLLDTWSDSVQQTSKTAAFMTAIMTLTGGEYPLYTAATYDAIYMMAACLEEAGYVDGGVGKADADDILAFYETPAKAVEGTAGTPCLYQQAGTDVSGTPALTEAQVRAIYDIDGYGYTYDVNDWLMPPNTTHDLTYGPGRVTGIGCQWQWSGAVWEKKGVWPMEIEGADLVDQYGDWNFEYTGTVPLVIPQYVLDHF